MNHLNTGYKIRVMIVVFAMAVGFSSIIVMSAHSHGGKIHGGETFTALQALQQATQLYNRLIASGKLSEEWEIGLKTVKIATRNSSEKREYVVQFERTKGDPRSVYFFFNQNGEYSGSNFTGK
ncbi:MAG: DUF6488 family protein [Thermodesulfobacteriota bacterium]|nr:DUF6488 family protein [Thermodesulfobacteriota bacterium]